jgi:hypothetical protein
VWLLFKCGDIFNTRSKAKNPYVQESNKMKCERKTLGIVLFDTSHWLLFCLSTRVLEKLWGTRLVTSVRNPTTLWIMNTVHNTPPSNIPAKFECLRCYSRCLKQENQWIPKANGISIESHNQDQMITYLWMPTGSLRTAKGLRKFHLFSTGKSGTKIVLMARFLYFALLF